MNKINYAFGAKKRKGGANEIYAFCRGCGNRFINFFRPTECVLSEEVGEAKENVASPCDQKLTGWKWGLAVSITCAFVILLFTVIMPVLSLIDTYKKKRKEKKHAKLLSKR